MENSFEIFQLYRFQFFEFLCEGAELNNFLMYFMFSVSTVVHIHYVHVGSMSVVG